MSNQDIKDQFDKVQSEMNELAPLIDELPVDNQPPPVEPPPDPSEVHIIKRGVSRFDARNVKPGEVIELEPGTRGQLRIENINGIGKRIQVHNHRGGVVDFNLDTSKDSAMIFKNSSHFTYRGNGSTDHVYGIEISRTRTGYGIEMRGACTDYTFGNMRLHGITSKSVMKINATANCDNLDWGNDWSVRNVLLHDLHLHDNTAEGLYIGSSYSWAKDYVCDGETEKRTDPKIIGLVVRNLTLDNHGKDAVQIGGAHDVQVFGVTINGYGLRNIESHREGLRFGRNCTNVEVWNNKIVYGAGAGLVWNHLKGTLHLHDNVIRRAGYIALNEKVENSASVWIHSSTGSTWKGKLDKTEKSNVLVEDNILVESGGKPFNWGGNAGSDNQIINNTIIWDVPQMDSDDPQMIKMKGDGPLKFEGNVHRRVE